LELLLHQIFQKFLAAIILYLLAEVAEEVCQLLTLQPAVVEQVDFDQL
jgi:hypothetical protein